MSDGLSLSMEEMNTKNAYSLIYQNIEDSRVIVQKAKN